MKPAKNTQANTASSSSIIRNPFTWILLLSLTTFSSCFRSSYRSSEGCPSMNQPAMRASFRN